MSSAFTAREHCQCWFWRPLGSPGLSCKAICYPVTPSGPVPFHPPGLLEAIVRAWCLSLPVLVAIPTAAGGPSEEQPGSCCLLTASKLADSGFPFIIMAVNEGTTWCQLPRPSLRNELVTDHQMGFVLLIVTPWDWWSCQMSAYLIIHVPKTAYSCFAIKMLLESILKTSWS